MRNGFSRVLGYAYYFDVKGISMNLSDYVYEKLTDDGVVFKNGQRERLVCPDCGKAHLSVRPDKGWATCWYPGCDYKIRPERNYKHSWVIALFEVLYEDWKKFLSSDAALDYRKVLTEQREILPALIGHLPIGVIPPNYDLSRAISAARNAMVTDDSKFSVEELDEEDRPKSQNKKFEEWLANPFGQTKEKPISLQQFIHSKHGWFARFYVNANGDFIATNLRCSWEKDFRKIQPLPYMGVYQPFEFDEQKPEPFTECPGDMLCFEGEVNLEQFYSECIRHFITENPDWKPPIHLDEVLPNACALGGVTTWDLETASRLARSPVVCYDNDGGAGLSGLEQACSFMPKSGEKMSVSGFTTPTKDADEYFKGGVGTVVDFANLWRTAKKPTISFDVVRAAIDATRKQDGVDRNERLSPFEVEREVAKTVWEDLFERGQFFTSGGLGMVFLQDDRKLVDISNDGHDFSNLMIRYGLLPADTMKDAVGKYLGAQSSLFGTPTDTQTFSYYNAKHKVVYISEFDGNVIRISRERIERVPNGTDGVLFKTPNDCQPFHIDLDKLPTCKYGLRLDPDSMLVKFITSQVDWDEETLTTEQYQTLFVAQMMTLFMRGVIRTKPLVLMTGESGSGKTMLAERVGWLLLGSKFFAVDMPEEKDDFEALVTGTPFAVLDNVQKFRKSASIQSLLMITATGGGVSKRELYSTNKQVIYPVQATLYLSAVNSPFRGDEVANRLLIFPTRKLTAYRDSADIQREFMEHREEIMNEVVARIQNILVALDVNDNLQVDTPFRMADFATYLLKVASYEGWGADAERLLALVGESQNSYAVEDDAVVELFFLWIGANPTKSGNRWWSAAELDAELRDSYLRGGRLPWNEGDAKAMSGYIRNHQDTLGKMFGLEHDTDRHMKMKKYRFKPGAEMLLRLREEADRRMGTEMENEAHRIATHSPEAEIPLDKSEWWAT
jgi:hypothetical protein